MASKYHYEGTPIKEPESGYFNLGTRRVLGETSKLIKGLVCIKNPNVCGSKKAIEDFKKENRLEETVKDKAKLAIQLAAAATLASVAPKSTSSVKLDKTTQLLKKETPRSGPEPDVGEIPDSALLMIPKFSMEGTFSKVRLVSVLDADTFDMVFYFYNKGYKGTGEGWMLIRDHVRLYGIDSAEKKGKDKALGKQASERVKERLKKHGTVYWAEFLPYDLYGRILANLYFDEKKKESVNAWILDLKCKDTGVCLVNPYFGKTKAKFSSKQEESEREQSEREQSDKEESESEEEEKKGVVKKPTIAAKTSTSKKEEKKVAAKPSAKKAVQESDDEEDIIFDEDEDEDFENDEEENEDEENEDEDEDGIPAHLK